jgi:hypothetical protein
MSENGPGWKVTDERRYGDSTVLGTVSRRPDLYDGINTRQSQYATS